MKTGSQYIYYQFTKDVDLTDKADIFISKLHRLTGLSLALNQVVKHETKQSEGQVIDSIYDEIEEHTRTSQSFYGGLDIKMKNVASTYDQIVNGNRFQYITVHYDIIDMNRD